MAHKEIIVNTSVFEYSIFISIYVVQVCQFSGSVHLVRYTHSLLTPDTEVPGVP